jgi:hypothetical protein
VIQTAGLRKLAGGFVCGLGGGVVCSALAVEVRGWVVLSAGAKCKNPPEGGFSGATSGNRVPEAIT